MENQNINTERVTITLGDATFQLQEQHDLNWIHELGHVFCVFDEQDSGNISFGFNINGTRRFLKYAGARPLEYKGMPEDAAKRLSAAVAVYQKLEHPHLIKLVDHFATRDGTRHCSNGLTGKTCIRTGYFPHLQSMSIRTPLFFQIQAIICRTTVIFAGGHLWVPCTCGVQRDGCG